jgi:hypothetical protein
VIYLQNKKSQAAMEFLMTYGWAILVVLVVIGALAYFGVLSPDNFLPERCEFPSQMNCEDYKVTASQIQFKVRNGAGQDIVISKMNATTSAFGGTLSCVNSTDITIFNSEAKIIPLTGCTIPAENVGSSKKIKWSVKITWKYSGTSFSHTANGNLMAKVEE